MSNRTWVCIRCRKSYRRSQEVRPIACPTCGAACEEVHWKIRIPSPSRPEAWEEFWAKYLAEKALLAAYHRGELRESVRLELLRMELHVS